MIKKFYYTLLASFVLISTLFLVGCSGSKTTFSVKSSDFSKFEDRGYVTVGFDDTFVPMGFKDDNGKIVGFDIDLAKEVFKRIDVKVKFQPIDWSMKETELNSGKIDLIWNGYTITDERKEKVAFTKPYIENRQIIVTLADSSIKKKSDLAGKVVAAQNGSSSLDAINKEPELAASFKDGEPVLFETNNEALMDLEAGRTDAVVADEIMAKYYIAKRGEKKYKVIGEDFGKEEYGIGMRKADTELLEKVENALKDMRNEGVYSEIYKKWFGEITE
ncbi:MAG: extracellular solute-binding protein family 3 [Bacillales bacterium]|jgi:polar amino acid transport system substrate-binding protein|nr:extracellular solute-binding protein family 3 [Bacillales bacterium]